MMTPSPNTLRYKRLYEKLHNNGYHKTKNYSTAEFYLVGALSKIKFNSILDVGCGKNNLKNVFPNLVGLDISTVIKPDICGSITNLPFKDKCFDIIICSDVLEHLYPEDIDLAINELERVASKCLALRVADTPWYVENYKVHQTVKSINWWRGNFNNVEWVSHKDFLVWL